MKTKLLLIALLALPLAVGCGGDEDDLDCWGDADYGVYRADGSRVCVPLDAPEGWHSCIAGGWADPDTPQVTCEDGKLADLWIEVVEGVPQMWHDCWRYEPCVERQ